MFASAAFERQTTRVSAARELMEVVNGLAELELFIFPASAQ